MDIENPIYVDVIQELVHVRIPIARVIRTEVEGRELIEPKSDTDNNLWTKLEYWSTLTVFVLSFIGILGGFVVFIIWLNNPELFGSNV